MRKAIGTSEQEVLKRLLRAYRKEAGLSQAEVAARLQTTASRISEYETGERRADLIQLFDLCNLYGVNLIAFVTRFVEEVEQERQARDNPETPDTDPNGSSSLRRRTIARRTSR